MNHTKELIELAHQGNKEARDVLVMENMVGTEAVIALAFGTVPEFQLRMIGIRAAADFTLVAVAPLRLRPLLLADGGFKLNGLPGPLVALDAQHFLDVLPEKDDKVQDRHPGGQGAAIGAIGH